MFQSSFRPAISWGEVIYSPSQVQRNIFIFIILIRSLFQFKLPRPPLPLPSPMSWEENWLPGLLFPSIPGSRAFTRRELFPESLRTCDPSEWHQYHVIICGVMTVCLTYVRFNWRLWRQTRPKMRRRPWSCTRSLSSISCLSSTTRLTSRGERSWGRPCQVIRRGRRSWGPATAPPPPPLTATPPSGLSAGPAPASRLGWVSGTVGLRLSLFEGWDLHLRRGLLEGRRDELGTGEVCIKYRDLTDHRPRSLQNNYWAGTPGTGPSTGTSRGPAGHPQERGR